MGKVTWSSRARGHGDLVFGLIAAVVLGLSTMTSATGHGAPPDSLPPSVVLAGNGAATLILLGALVVGWRRGRVSRQVVVGTGWALGVVMAWLIVVLANDFDALTLFALIWTAMFTACLLTRTPDGSGTARTDRAGRR